jgi:hypothetical protein
MIDNTVKILDVVMNEIIDELNPNYKPVTDEELIETSDNSGVFQRVFKHKTGSEFLLKWTVYYGTPETVRTVFHPVEEL